MLFSEAKSIDPLLLPPPGQCQFCEPTGLANVADVFHVNTGGQLLMSFDVSSSKQALAFGDSGGGVHLWSDAPEVSYNDYSRETEFAHPCLVDSLHQLDWNHELLPLSLIPTPLTSAEQLLSDWPTPMVTPRPRLGTGRLYGPAVIPVGPLVTTLVSDDKTQCPT